VETSASFEARSAPRSYPTERDFRYGSIAAGRGKLQVQPCPQCPVSDGRPEKRDLSLRAKNRHRLHSITLSARATSNGGSSIPSVFAVFRLMLNSNLVGWKMGMSAGLAPFRIWSTMSATRCPTSEALIP
jgi:hypothetical protein